MYKALGSKKVVQESTKLSTIKGKLGIMAEQLYVLGTKQCIWGGGAQANKMAK